MNLGIEILRMILCFWIITYHFAGKINKSKYKILKTFYHVPTFMLISFYFSYSIFISKDIIKYKKRLERLLIPYIIYPLLFVLISFSFHSINIKQIIIDLLIQYISGKKIFGLGILWFIHNLIIFGIFFKIIYFLFNKQSLFILQIFFIISYLLQYKGINYKIFHQYPFYIRILSFIIEMMPIAITGLILRNIDIFKIISNDKKKSIFFSIIAIFFIYNYNIFGEIKGFNYQGIKQNIAGICLFISFSLIPFYKFNNSIILVIIKTITRYTGGIYYLQTFAYYVLSKFEYLNQKSFIKCLLIYIFGFLISFVFTKIFRNNRLKYLFN